MLRIWDCFLYEGPKVLFRFAIALLGLHEEQLLAHSDTISVIKLLKAAVKLTLDVDGMVLAFYSPLFSNTQIPICFLFRRLSSPLRN